MEETNIQIKIIADDVQELYFIEITNDNQTTKHTAEDDFELSDIICAQIDAIVMKADR